eukprot:CAMPEP_0180795290 /NCGR_PEP_ID=MMETSP1038_2-20121128/56117_1 /TAXON_ID=632150 /ORGANISM="Azadinium spinosum, Strain 3D9" /LENGTH=136 /DNA_ID=CAMNT_0022834193 /DNA_START=18 /DNA_END=428 /DNA_ORIENTATION=-
MACERGLLQNLLSGPRVAGSPRGGALADSRAVGEYSLNTGFPGSPRFDEDYMRNQLSLWANTPGVLGTFFWNHRILHAPGGWYRELSLLDLLAPQGPIHPIASMALSKLCPGRDLGKCPAYNAATVSWDDECVWVT